MESLYWRPSQNKRVNISKYKAAQHNMLANGRSAAFSSSFLGPSLSLQSGVPLFRPSASKANRQALGQRVIIFIMKHRSISSVFQELTSSHIADEFNTFSRSQILEAKRILAEPSNSRILAFAQFLMNDYSFENLLLKDEKKRKTFAFTMAQCWLSTRTNPEISMAFSFLNCFASPLSAIITSDYQLIIDETAIIENLTNKKVGDLISPKISKTPVDYEKRFSN